MMKHLKLIVEHLRYFRARSLFMFVAITLAFLTYGVLGSLRYSLNSGEASISEQRLVTTHEMGLMQALPLAYHKRIRMIDGVGQVGHATWMGSFFQEQRNMLMAFAVDAPVWLAQHPDMVVSEAARSRFLRDRRGMLVSRPLALKYGWKVGDAVPLKSVLFIPPSGDPAWTYIVSGVFTSNNAGGGRNYIITHYDYLNEDRRLWPNTVGTFIRLW
jgi:putative ABC transport system permease protein